VSLYFKRSQEVGAQGLRPIRSQEEERRKKKEERRKKKNYFESEQVVEVSWCQG
jgi:hypothetical protein